MGKTTKNAEKQGKPAAHAKPEAQAAYIRPADGQAAAIPPPVLGGSYAGIVNRLKHPRRPDHAMLARGIVQLLDTNHFDAAVMVAHGLADLMDDFCLREAEGRQ